MRNTNVANDRADTIYTCLLRIDRLHVETIEDYCGFTIRERS